MTRHIVALTAIFLLAASTAAFAQSKPAAQPSMVNPAPGNPAPGNPAPGNPAMANPGGSVDQAQGKTGPIATKSGGAPAASPQGDTPAGMQAAPQGSDKTVESDESGTVKGTPKN